MSITGTDLVKQYRKRVVVDRVSIEVHRGEVVGLLGPNGAGKTTTFRMIVGLERPDSGDIIVDGRTVTDLPMYERGRLGIGYLPQEPSVFRKMTVTGNIQAILELQPGLQDMQGRVEELLGEFRLEPLARHRGYQLSGGERRRCEIARAVAANPSFILLDEPFAGVDPIAVVEVQEMIGRLKQNHLGLLITDHNVRETLRICDRAYILRDGAVLVSGAVDEVAEHPLARQYYLGSSFRL